MSDSLEDIASPCIGVCSMNQESGECEGCYRTIEEIREWWNMSAAERGQVMERLQQRQAAAFDSD